MKEKKMIKNTAIMCVVYPAPNVEKGFVRSLMKSDGGICFDYREREQCAHILFAFLICRERENTQCITSYMAYILTTQIFPPGDRMLRVVPQILCCSPDEGT